MEFLSKHADTKFYAIPNPSLFNGNASSRAEPGTSTAAKVIDALMQAYASVATYERGGSEYHFARAAYDSLHSLSVSNPTIQKWYDVVLNGQLYGYDDTISGHSLYTRFQVPRDHTLRSCPCGLHGDRRVAACLEATAQ